MTWRVEIKEKQGIVDTLGLSTARDILDLGIKSISRVETQNVFTLEGNISESQIQTICKELLVNPIAQEYAYFSENADEPQPDNARVIEIAYHAGVMDPVEGSTVKGINDLGVTGIDRVRTSRKYVLFGAVSPAELDTIINKILANKLIQHVVDHSRDKKVSAGSGKPHFKLTTVDIIAASSKKLLEISQKGQLFLNLNEMLAIQKYFKKLKRNPTDCELETIAQTWSEHCYHKTFRGKIRYRYKENGRTKTKVIDSLLRSTIAKVTYTLKKPWCVSVFHDNAGVIKFDNEMNVCFKVETHNHPSALEPFGGANTGVGGVIRDTLGTGLGGKPICNTDIFCFAPPDMPFDELPPGTLHPKRIMKGVVSGVRDYGNKMGIPTVNGAIVFDKKYVGNPLVYCGNVGLLPKDKVKKTVHKGDLVVVLGGRTGRDGIHGATFSSGELTSESEVISSGAVQIGNPIQEKKTMDALLRARDLDLYCAVTDCGAGGLSSAVGEMGQDLGARVDLEKVPLKYQGLNYTEIWISESQERMVIAVPPQNIEKLKKVFNDENVEATAIGEFTGTKRLELSYEGKQVCNLDMEFLHAGPPKVVKDAVWAAPKLKVKKIFSASDLTPKLKQVLSHYNVCSKESVIRQYDHEVQGATVLKPLVGVNCDGPSDAAVITPRLGSYKGIAISNGINPRYGSLDPFWMAASCIDEAIRQIISVGGSLDRIAILDNFCWGNPDKADRLGSLVRCAEGCYKIALAYKVPFISGKDSLYNEYTEKNKSIAIPGTLLISAIGIVDDVRRCVSMDLKKPGNLICIIGETKEELGGSVYLDTFGLLDGAVPEVSPLKAVKIFKALELSVKQGLIRSMHDVSDGGIAVALAEMAFAGGLGVNAELNAVPFTPLEKTIKNSLTGFQGKEKRNDSILFSESNSRFIAEVAPQDLKKLEKNLKGLPFAVIGKVESTKDFILEGVDHKVCIKADINDLKEAWQKPLRW